MRHWKWNASEWIKQVTTLKIRLGIIGPLDSVEKIAEITRKYSEFEYFEFCYEKTEEVENIIRANHLQIDQWLFSGQAPYAFAVEKGLITKDRGMYPTLHGSSLLGKFLEAQFQHSEKLSSISLDTILEAEIDWVKSTYSLGELVVYTMPYPGYLPSDEMIAFHRNKYHSGEAELVFTCISSVYNQLKSEGIPVFRITATTFDIDAALRFLRERGNANWYRNNQLAIVGVEVFYSRHESDEQFYSYKRKHQELELKRLLLDYTEELKGSFVQIGDGMFYIYTTRGEVESQQWPFHLLEAANLQSKLMIRVVVGYGVTAFEAEQHVRLALKHGRKHEKPVIISVNENKQVTEAFHSDEAFTYDQRRIKEQWKGKLGNSNLSPAVVSKLSSLLKHYRKTEVTSSEIAQWLSSSERNARRILNELEQVNLAQIVGEEQSGSRGRPKKVYRLEI